MHCLGRAGSKMKRGWAGEPLCLPAGEGSAGAARDTWRGAGLESRLRSCLEAATAVVLKYLLSLIAKMVPQHWHQRVNRVIAGT